MEKKNALLETALKLYYNNPQNMESFCEILRDKSCISLRLIDWFVTKYAKMNNIQYNWIGKTFYVYNSYRSQLKAYSKRQMDPFCRRERISLQNDDYEIITTVGQMNFFRWAIENGVLKYICDNFENIDKSMKKESKTKSKKKITVRNTKKTFSRTQQHVTVMFD
jgi:hypothetical protein|tara:strand:+ start:5972 stop:6466 length:495 start_codon:yes stop_codon:yes gene_type:complete